MIVAVLVLAIALSPILAPVATLALLFFLVVLVLRYRRGRSLRGWGIAAASSLVLVVVLTGVSNAVYGPSSNTEQAAAPEVTVEEAQAEEETPVEATQEEETSVEVAASPEETLEESEPPVEEEDEFAPLEDTRPTPRTPKEMLERNITDAIDPVYDSEYKNLQDLQIQQGAGQCYDIYVAFKGSAGLSFIDDWR